MAVSCCPAGRLPSAPPPPASSLETASTASSRRISVKLCCKYGSCSGGCCCCSLAAQVRSGVPSSVVVDAGSSAGVELRDTEADHAAPGAASPGRRQPCRSFIPGQTNFSGDPGLFMRQIPVCAPPRWCSRAPDHGPAGLLRHFSTFYARVPVGGCRWRWRRDRPTHGHPLLPSPNSCDQLGAACVTVHPLGSLWAGSAEAARGWSAGTPLSPFSPPGK